MDIIKHIANIPGAGPRIIAKMLIPLNVEVFNRKSKASSEEQLMV